MSDSQYCFWKAQRSFLISVPAKMRSGWGDVTKFVLFCFGKASLRIKTVCLLWPSVNTNCQPICRERLIFSHIEPVTIRWFSPSCIATASLISANWVFAFNKHHPHPTFTVEYVQTTLNTYIPFLSLWYRGKKKQYVFLGNDWFHYGDYGLIEREFEPTFKIDAFRATLVLTERGAFDTNCNATCLTFANRIHPINRRIFHTQYHCTRPFLDPICRRNWTTNYTQTWKERVLGDLDISSPLSGYIVLEKAKYYREAGLPSSRSSIRPSSSSPSKVKLSMLWLRLSTR